ncbi:unnamed protein product [Spirodela intermedia]|uniref:BPL/LPL catalytic domain-containing protein n=1 Tax=Spirodela intermedia TaxID=51605 RepID=A0A7I8IRE6_SPIIN|nr:unnamed protein product [Spirodela intermedia]CAA6660561.1 unnamed protein product [Spirodela intermedia]
MAVSHAKNGSLPLMNLVRTTAFPIINQKLSDLVETRSVLRDRIPVVRRFSGGGTVVVGKGTIFVTFICNKDAVPGLQPYPCPIMSWTARLYAKALHDVVDFSLRENDYVFGDRKFGGNAQSITRARWLHHTSFLWDYDARNMRYLKHPPRAPSISRRHEEFLCPMKGFLSSSSDFVDRTVASIEDHFSLRQVELGAVTDSPAAAGILSRPSS